MAVPLVSLSILELSTRRVHEGDCRCKKSTLKAGSRDVDTTLEYSTRVLHEGDCRCKKSTLNDLVHLTPLRIRLMNRPYVLLPYIMYVMESGRFSHCPVFFSRTAKERDKKYSVKLP